MKEKDTKTIERERETEMEERRDIKNEKEESEE